MTRYSFKTIAGMPADVSEIETMTRHELARINAIFARGKGTWPQPDYIKDDDWNRLLGEQYAFNEVLRWLGVAVNERN